MIEEFKKKMNRALHGLGWGEADEWIRYSLIASVLFFLLSILFAKEVWLIVFCILSFLPVLGVYVVPVYFWASRQKQIETELPQALYRAASNAFVPLDELIGELAQGKSELAKEFRKTEMQIRNGVSIEDALEEMGKANDSRLLRRAIDLLLQSYQTGADMSSAFKETAEEISGIATVMRDQAASTTIEKYTLLLAGGAIVPLVLGTLVAMVGSLNFMGLAELGFGSGTKDLLLANALAGSQIYIMEYALLSSVFVAYQENSIEKAVVYAAVLVPLSMALFTLAKSGIIV